MTTLVEAQVLFSRCLGRLLTDAPNLGYDVSMGECWRPPEMAEIYAARGTGIANSLHCDRLAVDLILRKDDVLLDSTEDYRPLGELWESYHPTCRWGGRFGDGDHFSIAFGDRK